MEVVPTQLLCQDTEKWEFNAEMKVTFFESVSSHFVLLLLQTLEPASSEKRTLELLDAVRG